MVRKASLVWSLLLSLVIALPTTVASAQEEELGVVVAEDARPTIDTGDNAWMLTSSALVLMMTAPGLALFYGGLVRKKNVLSVMMQCFFLMGLMTVIWALYGYSLAFSTGPEGFDAFIGGTEHLFMEGVQPYWDESAGESVIPQDADKTIPRLTFMVFQGMFFIITPALICGAFAERMKFSAMVIFMIVWGTVVYCPLAHWVWGGGFMAYGGDYSHELGFNTGAIDFAGGTVVHISSGISALVCALVLGSRLGFRSDPMPPHNMTYTTIGAAMLWVGWFGFNAGSELAADGIASSAFVVTHFAAAAGAIAWAGMEWILRGKPSVLGACSGAVAGLVCITPAAGFVLPMPALLMGAAAGVLCFLACTTLKSKLGYDDSLDAFGVHGVGGTVGAILTGVFATRSVAPKAISDLAPNGGRLGLYENGDVFGGQVAATAVTWVFAAVASYIILKVIDLTIGLRVSQAEEIDGLDQSQHGEEGYIFI